MAKKTTVIRKETTTEIYYSAEEILEIMAKRSGLSDAFADYDNSSAEGGGINGIFVRSVKSEEAKPVEVDHV